MNTSLIRASALSCALLAGTALTCAPALAQWAPPPPHFAIDSRGVDTQSGRLLHSQIDLSIGQGSFPGGIELTRTYLPYPSHTPQPSVPNSLFGVDWTHSLDLRVYSFYDDSMDPSPTAKMGDTTLHVVIGGKAHRFFRNYGATFWMNQSEAGTHVATTGETPNLTTTFTDRDGTVAVFEQAGQKCGSTIYLTLICGNVTSWTAPSGERLEFSYEDSGSIRRLKSVMSNRGYAMAFEYPDSGARASKACAINLATTYYAAGSACPSGARSVNYTPPVASGNATVTTADGVRSYSYDANGSLTATTPPSSSIADFAVARTGKRVSSYRVGAEGSTTHGGTWTYSYADPELDTWGWPQANSQTNITAPDGGETKVHYKVTLLPDQPDGNDNTKRVVDPMPDWVDDPLNRRTSFEYADFWQIGKQTGPEGDSVEYTYDLRGNVTHYRKRPKPGSGLADITMSAVFPTDCINFKTCNKPTSVTDPAGAVTDFTYDPSHGGVLTETGPAVNNVRPQKRYSYAQRNAWIKNSAGGFVQAATPIWVLTQESSCQTSAATGNPAAPCATAGDEVVTAYEYGPDASPNNLLLRGTVQDAGGLSLRTCFSYDTDGNQISKTEPRAGLSACS